MTHTQYKTYFVGTLAVIVIANAASLLIFLMSPEMFYYRPWEYFDELAYRFEHFDTRWDAKETSDLTRKNFFYYQDPHQTHVTTDTDGFRSVPKASTAYSIVVAGDSTIFGSGLSDDETLPWLLTELLDMPVFNGARTSLSNLLKNNALKDVELIIDGHTERSIKGRVFNHYGLAEDAPYTPLLRNDKSITELVDIVPAQRYLITSILLRTPKRLKNDLRLWFKGNHSERLLMRHTMNADDLAQAVAAIKQRSDSMQQKGIRYIFVAVPAKQTIYSSDVDEYTKNYVAHLTHRLHTVGVETISLVDEFQQQAASGLFRDYDTHWNEKGVRVAARKIADHLNSTSY